MLATTINIFIIGDPMSTKLDALKVAVDNLITKVNTLEASDADIEALTAKVNAAVAGATDAPGATAGTGGPQ